MENVMNIRNEDDAENDENPAEGANSPAKEETSNGSNTGTGRPPHSLASEATPSAAASHFPLTTSPSSSSVGCHEQHYGLHHHGSHMSVASSNSNLVSGSSMLTNTLLDVHKGRPIRLQVKVLVPIHDHPNYNFVGKLLGPKGNSLKWLQEQTQTKMAILGRGSMRDRAKEEDLRALNDPKHGHLNEDLHVEITCYAAAPEAYLRIGHALHEIKRFLVPDYYDEIRQQQLRELGVLNTDPPGLAAAATSASGATAALACGADGASVNRESGNGSSPNSATSSASTGPNSSPLSSATRIPIPMSSSSSSMVSSASMSTASGTSISSSSFGSIIANGTNGISVRALSNTPICTATQVPGSTTLMHPHLAAAMAVLQQQQQQHHQQHHQQQHGSHQVALGQINSMSSPTSHQTTGPTMYPSHHHPQHQLGNASALSYSSSLMAAQVPAHFSLNSPAAAGPVPAERESGTELFDIASHYDTSWDSQTSGAALKIAAVACAQRKMAAAAAAATYLGANHFQGGIPLHPHPGSGLGPLASHVYSPQPQAGHLHARHLKPYTRIYPEYH